MFNLPNRTYFSRKRESIELDILNNSNSEQLLYRRNIISKSHRIKSFNYDQHIIQNKFQVQAINRNEEIKNLIKQYDIISKLTAFGWCLFATLLILISIIGFKIPNQTTGYACLKTQTCSSHEAWSKLYGMCKYVENTTCTNRTDCLEPMTCTANNICQCGPFQYHNLATLTCLPQQSYLGSCSIDFNCRVDKYLQCVSGACQCISAYPVWSDALDACYAPKIYNQYCYGNTDCNYALNLVCQDGTYNCTCPINIANNYCDCIRVLNNEYYWNGSGCVTCKNFNQTCTNSSSYMCKTLTQGTMCLGPYPYKCRCQTLQYFNQISGKCENQLLYGSLCLQADACRSDLGFICKGNICDCNSTIQFWDSTQGKCVNLLSYNAGTCTNDNQCEGNLICILPTVTSCSCPLTITNGHCDCPTRVVNGEYYWNGTSCRFAGKYGDSCIADYQCQVLTDSLSCDTCGGTYKCFCTNGLYDASNELCVPCAPNWYAHGGACYKGAWCPPVFSSITQAQINQAAYCGTVPGYNVVLAPGPFTNSDVNCWLSVICSPLVNVQAGSAVLKYFYGPVLSATSQCNTVTCPVGLSTHSCSHGASYHGIVCMYT